MPTIRFRVARSDQESFVGRAAELARFERMLDGEVPQRVVHLVGAGGIGKSALLREVSRRAADRGVDTVWIDGRDLPPFPDAIDAAFDGVAETAPALVVLDSYELISALDSHLRDRVIPELPDTTVVVFASRVPPARGWYEHGWDRVVDTVELGPLDTAVARELVRRHGVEDDSVADELVRRSHGSPLALVVGSRAGPGGSVAELAARLLGEEIEPQRLRILTVAALARVTTPELLAEVLDDADPHGSYAWLADRSFAEPLAAGVTLHVLVADAVREHVRLRDPAGEGRIRRRIADHLHRRAVAGNAGLSTDLQHLIVDPTLRWGYSSDVGQRYRIDTLRPGDTERIGAIMSAVGFEEWWAFTRVFFDRHPELVGIARDPDGRIGGYDVAVAPATAPPAAHADVLLGPWLRHAHDVLQTTSAVLWREAVDLTGELGEVTSLLGAGGLMSSGVANPRYLYLPISPEVPAAGDFSTRLGAVHVEALDLAVSGMNLQCHLVDFGPGGLIGNQRDWIYRETGVSPPAQVPVVDGAGLLKALREPSGASGLPAWLGRSPSERRGRLRDLVVAATAVFGPGHDDQLARSIIEHAYLGDNRPHESIARHLHLSRSAYFRRLQAASARVAEELATSGPPG